MERISPWVSNHLAYYQMVTSSSVQVTVRSPKSPFRPVRSKRELKFGEGSPHWLSLRISHISSLVRQSRIFTGSILTGFRLKSEIQLIHIGLMTSVSHRITQMFLPLLQRTILESGTLRIVPSSWESTIQTVSASQYPLCKMENPSSQDGLMEKSEPFTHNPASKCTSFMTPILTELQPWLQLQTVQELYPVVKKEKFVSGELVNWVKLWYTHWNNISKKFLTSKSKATTNTQFLYLRMVPGSSGISSLSLVSTQSRNKTSNRLSATIQRSLNFWRLVRTKKSLIGQLSMLRRSECSMAVRRARSMPWQSLERVSTLSRAVRTKSSDCGVMMKDSATMRESVIVVLWPNWSFLQIKNG